ncbi:hypothetical protein PG993_002355 [Apiospora rasikravindrae]|uniref:Heterokaryon incompatibility domain-containing protein n=1 Tax=Apiospora rasikravindrae TaxID=990691 RepID=A0ABR1TWE1_9PEZI
MIQDEEISVERNDLMTVHQHCPDRPYLELTIPDNATSVTFIQYNAGLTQMGKTGHRPGSTLRSVDLPTGALCPTSPFSSIGAASPSSTLISSDGGKSTLAKRAWLASLLPGDVIQIIPRAKFQSWVNIVREARITIGFQFDDSSTSLSASQELGQSSKRLHGASLTSTRDEIRVLLLHPADNHNDPVFCSLHHLRLGQKDEFEPLSYCWGDGGKMEDITIDAEPIGGPQSIVEALRQLRLQEKPRRLWIDQLCINQNDTDEKTQQVGLMSRVYSEASMVHIWLGLGDRATRAALALVRDIYNYDRETFCLGGDGCKCTGTRHVVSLQDLKKRSKNHRGSRASYEGLGDIFKLHLKTWPAEVRQWASGRKGSPNLSQVMSCLFSNPWFRRVWVIQEALCPRRAVVRCGPEVVPWDEVLHTNAVLSSIEFAGSQPYSLTPAVTMPSVWNVLCESLRESRQILDCTTCADGRMCILCVFLYGLSLQATVPQDKLYALLPFGWETCGQQRKEEVEEETIPHLPRPDYAIPVETVMANFVRWWITQYRSLDILSWVHCQPGRTWLRTSHDSSRPVLTSPTWALGVDGKRTWGEAALLHEHRYSATDDSVPDLGLITQSLVVGRGEHQDPLQLKLRGYRICEIQEITYLALDKQLPGTTFKNNKNGSRTNSNPKTRNRNPPPADEDLMTKPAASLLRAFDRTFDPAGTFKFWNSWWPQSDRPHDHRPRERILHRLLEPSAGPFTDHVAANTRYYQQRPADQEAYSFEELSSDASAPLVRCSADVGCPACLDPFFFVGSDGGKTKGLCPWPAIVGDVVVLLSGGKVPYLLRPIPNEEGGGGQAEETLQASLSNSATSALPSDTTTPGRQQSNRQYYQFVGECFVMGAMSGKYYEKQMREGRELAVFTLV